MYNFIILIVVLSSDVHWKELSEIALGLVDDDENDSDDCKWILYNLYYITYDSPNICQHIALH